LACSVSLIVTVLNEAKSIDILISSLLAQTRLPDEIVIVDGGSCDGTPELLKAWQERSAVPLQVHEQPGCNIAQGRNTAIRLAVGDIIAVTDAGVRLPVNWLANLLAPFDEPNAPDVVSGFFYAAPESCFERVLGAITLPRLTELAPARFMPSSRSVAYRRQAWQSVGGYPEWLDYGEDLVFDFTLKDAGMRFALAPEAAVWFRPRPDLSSFYRQYYRYSRGDGKADLYIYRHMLRYTIYIVICASILLGIWINPWFLLMTALSFAAVLGRPLRRLVPELRKMSNRDRLLGMLWLPVIVVTGDLAKMLGYPVGVRWRRKHKPEISWAKRRF